MKLLITALTCALLCSAPLVADVVTSSQAENQTANVVSLPENEMHIRQGIILLGSLCQNMAGIDNYDKAEAAVPSIMRLCEELQQWTQAFNHLPPVSELEAQILEDRYLPTIRKINHIIEAQADRLGAAEFYGSKNLPAALVHVAQIGHN